MNRQNKNYKPQQLEGVKTPGYRKQERRLSAAQKPPISRTANSSEPIPRKSIKRTNKIADDEVLGVIRDQRNGYTYYVSVIDNFQYNGVNYVVMYNYKGEDYDKIVPEILIMRSYRDHDKQYFTSIHDRKEMDIVFDVFYDRFQQSI